MADQQKPNAMTTTKGLNAGTINDATLSAELKRAKLAFSKEKTVKVAVPAVLKSSLGRTLFVGVNGVFVNIPVDGKEYEVPETFANHVKQVLANLK